MQLRALTHSRFVTRRDPERAVPVEMDLFARPVPGGPVDGS